MDRSSLKVRSAEALPPVIAVGYTIPRFYDTLRGDYRLPEQPVALEPAADAKHDNTKNRPEIDRIATELGVTRNAVLLMAKSMPLAQLDFLAAKVLSGTPKEREDALQRLGLPDNRDEKEDKANEDAPKPGLADAFLAVIDSIPMPRKNFFKIVCDKVKFAAVKGWHGLIVVPTLLAMNMATLSKHSGLNQLKRLGVIDESPHMLLTIPHGPRKEPEPTPV